MTYTGYLATTNYNVTIALNTPTDYTSLTGNNAGGVDNCASDKYNRKISITGTANSPTVTAAHSIFINGYEIILTGGNLTQTISDINSHTADTMVFAHVECVAGYLTLTNASTTEGRSFWISAGTGTALADLGLTAGNYSKWPNELSGALTLTVANNDYIKINGVTVTFVTGALTVVGMCNTINSLTYLHNVVAYPSANLIQMASNNGQPWTLAEGSAGTLAKLGFAAGMHGGYPAAYVTSTNKERAVMRWEHIVNAVIDLVDSVTLNAVTKSGQPDGNGVINSISFALSYDRAYYLSTPDELNPGATLTGAAAIKRQIARSLTATLTRNRIIFDPTITQFGDNCARANPSQVVQLTAAPLDTNISTLEGNITVTAV
jgi:hypothetical protein